MASRQNIRHEAAAIVEGPDFILGTVDSGTTTTIVDAAELTASDNTYKGREVFLYSDAGGASAAPEGESGRISASSSSSTNITFPTMTAATASGDKYEIHTRGLKYTDYNDTINAAHRAVKLIHLLPKVDESLMLSNRLDNGAMYTWTSSSACTSWAVDGNSTMTRESSIIYNKIYSAKIVTDGANEGYITQSVPNYPLFGGQSATLRMWVYTTTASRVRARLTDGVTTWNSPYHDGEGWPGVAGSPLEITSQSLGDDPTELTARLYIDSGSEVTAYLGRVELEINPRGSDYPDYIYEYNIPSGFMNISEVWRESPTHNEYYFQVPSRWWTVKPDSTRKLLFSPDGLTPTPGYRIMLRGQGKATEPTADSSTIELNEEFAKAYVVAQLLSRDLSTEAKVRKQSYWEAKAQQLMRQYSAPIGTNARSVETT